jgi:trimethylamine--corrinoid protein Co-methyltransferase
MRYFEILSDTDVEQVHEATLQVMETVGLDILYPPARELYAHAGGKVDGDRVFFPKTLVEAQIKKAPKAFCLHARNPDHNVTIGADQTLFLPANCPAFVSDLDHGRRYGTLADYENFVKLTGHSSNLDMSSNILIEPSDIPVEQRNVNMLYATMKYTDKCFMGGALGLTGAGETMDMVAMLFGIEKEKLPDKARVVSIPCSLTPLKYDESMLACLIAYAQAGQPVIVNSLAVAGATAPATLAGTLVVENAEILAGIVLAQLVREGSPVIYGGASTSADMRTGALAVGAPEMALNNIMTAQMARFYKIPSRSVGALTEAKKVGNQSAYESMMNLTAAVSSGLNLVLHAAGALESINCMSYEKFIIDDEMCGMARRMKRGVTIDSDTLALDVINRVGPGGHYLADPHTFRHFKTEFFMPQLANRTNYDTWKNSNDRDMAQRANRAWKEIVAEYCPPDLPPDIEADLISYVRSI